MAEDACVDREGVEERKRLTELLHRAQQALAAKPKDPGILCGMATCLMQLGRMGEAEDYYSRSLVYGPAHVGTVRMSMDSRVPLLPMDRWTDVRLAVR